MKINNYILFFIVTLFILTLAFELQTMSYPGLRAGNIHIVDSPGYISTNRAFRINGALQLYDTVLFKSYNSHITEGNNLLRYSTNSHIWLTKSGTALMSLDSSPGLQVSSITASSSSNFNDNVIITGFTQTGNNSLPVKTKLVKVYISTSVGWNTAAHSITNYRNILTWDFAIRDDSTGKFLPSGYNATPGMATGTLNEIDATNCRYYWSGTAGNIKTDTAYFWITYKE